MALRRYHAKGSSLCEVCDEGIRRGMLVFYVKPFTHWRDGWKRSVAIHERCLRGYELEREGEEAMSRYRAAKVDPA